jgi:hypothetical protein
MIGLQQKSAPVGYDPLHAQKAMQRRMKERFPDRPILAEEGASVAEAVEVVYLNTQAAIIELSEMLDHLPFKWWKEYGDSLEVSVEEYNGLTGSITEAKYELVDAMHFMLNCAIALGMSWEELLDIFYTKQQENFDRQERRY